MMAANGRSVAGISDQQHDDDDVTLEQLERALARVRTPQELRAFLAAASAAEAGLTEAERRALWHAVAEVDYYYYSGGEGELLERALARVQTPQELEAFFASAAADLTEEEKQEVREVVLPTLQCRPAQLQQQQPSKDLQGSEHPLRADGLALGGSVDGRVSSC